MEGIDENSVDIELNDEEAPFLANQSKKSIHASEPIKISLNPDGSMTRAALKSS